MKIHHTLLLALLLSVLAFGQAGCNRDDSDSEVGTLGIVVEQISGAPPSQVSKGEEFRIMVSLENKGGYDIQKGEIRVFLEGLEPSLFTLDSSDLKQENSRELRGSDLSVGVVGGRDQIVFTENARYIGQNVNFQQPIDYVICYDYESHIQTNICFALESGSVCSLENDKIEGATIGAAPVQITSITQQRRGQNVEVRFKIENVGNGKVFSSEANCESPEVFLENSLFVSVDTEEPFDCQLTDGEKQGEGRIDSIVICQRNMQGSTDHESPVKFRLRYKYVETLKSTLGVTE